jgi:hypothetical protein
MENIPVPLEEEFLEQNKEELNEELLAVIFAPSTSNQDKLIYKNRIDGAGECDEKTVVHVIKDKFPKAKIYVVSYYRDQAKYNNAFPGSP